MPQAKCITAMMLVNTIFAVTQPKIKVSYTITKLIVDFPVMALTPSSRGLWSCSRVVGSRYKEVRKLCPVRHIWHPILPNLPGFIVLLFDSTNNPTPRQFLCILFECPTFFQEASASVPCKMGASTVRSTLRIALFSFLVIYLFVVSHVWEITVGVPQCSRAMFPIYYTFDSTKGSIITEACIANFGPTFLQVARRCIPCEVRAWTICIACTITLIQSDVTYLFIISLVREITIFRKKWTLPFLPLTPLYVSF